MDAYEFLEKQRDEMLEKRKAKIRQLILIMLMDSEATIDNQELEATIDKINNLL